MISALDGIGRLLARIWLTALGFAIVFSFPICGFAVSIGVGAAIAGLIGAGPVGTIIFLSTMFSFGLFLAIFVWPHAKETTYSIVDRLLNEKGS